MYALPTLYKARGLSVKRPVCAICIERTQGRTEEVRLGYRVTVWLCPGHASHAFQTKRGGRDFVRTLMGCGRQTGA
jgi:hypothetical protein